MKNQIDVQIKDINGKLTVSSLVIAEGLRKEHKHIIEKIRAILCEPEFRLTSNKIKMPNGGYREEPEYLLTKDGFILLVMNFTGYNDFKRAYIRRFNEMEEQLKSPITMPFSGYKHFTSNGSLFIV